MYIVKIVVKYGKTVSGFFYDELQDFRAFQNFFETQGLVLNTLGIDFLY